MVPPVGVDGAGLGEYGGVPAHGVGGEEGEGGGRQGVAGQDHLHSPVLS